MSAQSRILFVRVRPSTREVLDEALRGMNASRPAGDPPLSLGDLVERCVMQTLSPGERSAAETSDPRQLALPLGKRRRRRGGK